MEKPGSSWIYGYFSISFCVPAILVIFVYGKLVITLIPRDMATNTPSFEQSTIVFNLSTTGHGSYDRDWEDYIDFAPGKGIAFDNHDYTYGYPEWRKDIRPLSEMPADMQQQARGAVIAMLQEEERIFNPGMWIGTTSHENYNLPCTVVRSRKFRGQATLINIVSKRDIYNGEIYKALIVGDDGLKYYVSPNCVKPEREPLLRILDKMSLKELLGVLDECHSGHWNMGRYNRYMFDFPDYVVRYAEQQGMIDLSSKEWGWKVKAAQAEQVAD